MKAVPVTACLGPPLSCCQRYCHPSVAPSSVYTRPLHTVTFDWREPLRPISARLCSGDRPRAYETSPDWRRRFPSGIGPLQSDWRQQTKWREKLCLAYGSLLLCRLERVRCLSSVNINVVNLLNARGVFDAPTSLLQEPHPTQRWRCVVLILC